MSSHTPVPWVLGTWTGQCHKDHTHGHNAGCVYDYTLSTGEDWCRCVSAGDPASHIELIGYDESGPILSHANAAFIVRACNSHEALTEALQEAMYQLRCSGLAHDHPDIVKFQTALALAKGTS